MRDVCPFLFNTGPGLNGNVLDASPSPLVTGEEQKESVLTKRWKAAYLPLTVLRPREAF